MTHPCHATQCTVLDLPDDKPFCGPHWHLIPSRLQNRFYHAHTSQQKADAVEACKQAIEQAEFGGRLL